LAELIQRVGHVRWTRNWATLPPQTPDETEEMSAEIGQALRILLDPFFLNETNFDLLMGTRRPAEKFGILLSRSQHNPG